MCDRDCDGILGYTDMARASVLVGAALQEEFLMGECSIRGGGGTDDTVDDMSRTMVVAAVARASKIDNQAYDKCSLAGKRQRLLEALQEMQHPMV